LATWQDLSSECLRAAKKLLDEGYLRRSVSSAYYAAYSAVTGELVARGITFAHGWNNPTHEQLPGLILHNSRLSRNARYALSRIMRRLRTAREAADYRPTVAVDQVLALACVRDAISVLFALGIEDDRSGREDSRTGRA
jgi:uncharacterized protein (UPF0332 family)